jgi:hypothetical protein
MAGEEPREGNRLGTLLAEAGEHRHLTGVTAIRAPRGA